MRPEGEKGKDPAGPSPQLYDGLAAGGPDCPPLEDWAAYAARSLPQTRATALLAHASKCAACGGLLADLLDETEPPADLQSASAEWQKEMAARLERMVGQPSIVKRRYSRSWFYGAAAAVLLIGVFLPASSFSVSWLLSRSAQRQHEFRLDGLSYRPQSPTLGTAKADSTSLLLARLLISVRDKVGIGGTTWSGVQGRAMLLDASNESQINAAIDLLATAHAAAPSDARIAGDFAVALLIRADQDAKSREMDQARAVEALKDALKVQEASSLYFNLALAYHRQNALASERAAWQRFLELEPEGGWADEARKKLNELTEKRRARARLPLRPEDAVLDIAKNGFEPFKNVDPVSVASEMERRGDTWLRDFLREAQRPENREGIAVLKAAAKAVGAGDADGEELSRKALNLFLKSGNQPGVAFASYELAYALQRKSNTGACVDTANQALTAIVSKKYSWLDVQLRLARSSCLVAAKTYREGYESATDAAGIARSAKYTSLEILAMGIQSGALREVGSYREAMPLDAESLRKYWSGEGGARSNAYQAYYASAVALQGLRYPQAAASFLEEALLLARFLPDRNQEAAAKSRYAEILEETGDTESASRKLLEVEDYFSRHPEKEYTARLFAQLPRARLNGRQGDIEGGLRIVEAMKAAMADPTRKNTAIETQLWNVNAELLARANRLEESEEALQKLLAIGESARISQPLAADRSALTRRVLEASQFLVDRYLKKGEVDRAWNIWTRYNGGFGSLPSGDPSARVIYTVLPSGPHALISTRQGIRAVKLAALDSTIPLGRELRDLAADPTSSMTRLEKVSRNLAALLITPLQSHLGGSREVYIAASEPFSVIPFSALIMPDGLWFTDHYRVIYSPPIAGYNDQRGAEIHPDLKLLAASYGAFGTPLGNVLPALGDDIEGTGRAAAATFSRNPEVLAREQATVSSVLQRLPDAEVFQFFGHAITAAADAALVLRADETSREGSLLWASRLSPSNLRRLKLAVLAACSTGRTPDQNRYPGSDMARAFLLSGVPLVIASSWDVDANATNQLILNFYDNVRKGTAVETALADAAANLRRQTAFAHPYYWSAFVLYRR